MPAFILALGDKIKDPVIFALVVAMIVTVGWLAKDHVSVSQFEALDKKIEGLQYTLNYNHIDTGIQSVQDKIFNVKQHIEDAKNHEVDPLYYQRLDELQRQEKTLENDMNLLQHGSK